MKKLAVAVVAVLLSNLVRSASGATPVCGPIDVDTSWTLAGSPYLVTCSIIVRNNATLTIEPGVELRFQAGTTLWIGTVSLGGGTLIADAQGGAPIIFTSAQPSPAPGDWTGIALLPSAVGTTFSGDEYVSGSILRNCIIEYARGDAGASLETSASLGVFRCVVRYGQRAGIECFSPTSVLVADCTVQNNRDNGIVTSAQSTRILRSTVVDNGYGGVLTGNSTTIDHCTIERNGAYGVSGNGQILLIEHSTIRQNGGPYGGIINDTRSLTVRCSTIENNVGSGDNAAGIYLRDQTEFFEMSMTNLINPGIDVRNGTLLTLDARDNWWGTTNPLLIEGKIFHCFDSPYVGCVEFQPFLLEPVPAETCGGTVATRPVAWGSLKSMYR